MCCLCRSSWLCARVRARPPICESPIACVTAGHARHMLETVLVFQHCAEGVTSSEAIDKRSRHNFQMPPQNFPSSGRALSRLRDIADALVNGVPPRGGTAAAPGLWRRMVMRVVGIGIGLLSGGGSPSCEGPACPPRCVPMNASAAAYRVLLYRLSTELSSHMCSCTLPVTSCRDRA